MDLVAFVRAHGPAASVYDLPRPYEANWNFLRLLRETAFLNRLGWVLTTLDKAALEAAVGPASVVQIVLGKPYGLDEVVAAVRQSLLRDGRGQDGLLFSRRRGNNPAATRRSDAPRSTGRRESPAAARKNPSKAQKMRPAAAAAQGDKGLRTSVRPSPGRERKKRTAARRRPAWEAQVDRNRGPGRGMSAASWAPSGWK